MQTKPVQDFSSQPSQSAASKSSAPGLSRNELILKYYPMVRRVAYRMAKRYPRCVDADDLVHIGTLGLIDAVDRFETNRFETFDAYARLRVQGAIVDEMRKNDWVPRSVRDRANRINRSRKELTTQLDRKPSLAELADFMGVDEARMVQLIETADVRTLVSTEEGSDEGSTIGDTIASEGESLEATVTREDTNSAVRGVLTDSLSERDQVIIRMYYYEDSTFREIAQYLGVTESRVSQLHSRIKRRLAEPLAAFSS
jgi:RNA polymerase sigma factor for flagellar operon FliA